MAVNNGNLPLQYNGSYTATTDGYSNFMDTGLGGVFDMMNPRRVEERSFEMGEQSANNQLLRDLYMQDIANDFNAAEAKKQRDWETEMANTAYQRTVADMKAAGINPILALGNGSSSIGTGASASASGARSGGSNYRVHGNSNTGALLSSLAMIAGGLISGRTELAVAGLKAAANSPKDKTTEFYNSKGKRVNTKIEYYR